MHRDSYAVKNIIFLLHVSKDPANSREANPCPLFCCIVCLVRQQQHWSQWRKHFVLFLKPLKLTSSEGGDVMWNEWLLFLSNFTILAWNLISYPIPIKEHPHSFFFFFFNKSELIDVQKDVFFLPLCSGQWAHAMFIRLKVSHCDERKGEKMQNIKGEAHHGHWQCFLCWSFYYKLRPNHFGRHQRGEG